MTVFTFYRKNGVYTGFRLRGHCNTSEDDFEGRLVCAAVSSAAQLTANTLSEILKREFSGFACDEECAEIYLLLKAPDQASGDLIDGLRFHVKELARQFPSRVSLCTEET